MGKKDEVVKVVLYIKSPGIKIFSKYSFYLV